MSEEVKDDKEKKLNKVFTHPEKEEIISRLLKGESVKGVEEWLRNKHPRKRKLWVSYATLQKFRKDHLHLEGEVLENIKAAKREQDDTSLELEAKAILASSSSYQKKISEIANTELDSNRKILEMLTLVGSRIEYYFNAVNLTDGKDTMKKDRMFMDLLNTQKGLIQDWKKYVEGVADKKIDHNINVTVVNEQITVLKSIIFEILQELDPELIPIFTERISTRLLDIQHGSSKYESYNQPYIYKQLDVIDADED